MADPQALDNLFAAAAGADVPKIGAIVDEVRQRVRERAREAVRRDVGGLASPAPGGASSRLPRVNALAVPGQGKDRPVSIRLPGGRRLQAVLSPGVARRSDLAAIARASADNNRRAFGALQTQGAAIESLKRAQEELVAKIGQLEKRADEAVLALTDTVSQSTRQLKQLAAQGQKALAQAGTAATTAVGQLKQVHALALTQQAQNLTNIIGSAQATAYGERGSVLAANNLLLTGNQLLWTFLAPLSQVFGASVGTSTVLGFLAPIGSLLTGYAAVGSRVPDREPVRFISGIAAFDGTTNEYLESLRDRIPDDRWDAFRRRTDVPVTVTPVDPIPTKGIFAEVTNGVLRIRVLAVPNRFRVAWMVDTGANGG